MLPQDGEISNIHTVDYKDDTSHLNDDGLAPNQNEQLEDDHLGFTNSSVLLPDTSVDI